MPMKYFVTIGSRVLEVELGSEGVTLDGKAVSPDLLEMDGSEVHTLLLGGRSHRILATRHGRGDWSLHLSGRHLRAGVVDERTRAIQEATGGREGASGPKALKAPMPGLVVKVEVEEGEVVAPGQGIAIVEAMKMENELKCEGEGRVKRILVAAGEAVDKDQVLVEFESLDSGGGGPE
jgi:biotin carboxyl carrier protein